MNELRKLFYLLLIIPIMFVNTGCSDDDNDDNLKVNEAEVLAKYIEDAGGNPINNYPAMISATDVNNAILTNDAGQVVLDIRSASDYAAGHIKGAVNVAATEVLNYYENNNLSSKNVVVLACYTGQSAAWATGLMHMLGYTNVKDLKFGMSSWNETTSAGWVSNTNMAAKGNRGDELTKTPFNKPAAGDLPVLSTGEQDGASILRARVEEVFAGGFAQKVARDAVMDNTTGFFIVNYWSLDHYNWNHINGAIQYTPKVDLAYDTHLKTLPTDKKVVVYCYTGQTSAHVAAYLAVLGYDSYSLLFGVNGIDWDNMPGSRFVSETEIKGYELVTP